MFDDDETDLRRILDPLPEPSLRTLEAEQYVWERLYGHHHIRRWVGVDPVVEDCTVDQWAAARHYGDRQWAVRSVVVFASGRALVCGAGYTFAGSFASHDAFEVRYYGLTPKEGW